MVCKMAARSWMEEAETLGAADLDFSAVVAAIVGEDPVSGGNGAHGPGARDDAAMVGACRRLLDPRVRAGREKLE